MNTRAACICDRIDRLVGSARLDHLLAVDKVVAAQLLELPVDLLVRSTPKEPYRGVESLGQLVARHGPLRQTHKNCFSQCHGASPHSSLYTLLHMGSVAYRVLARSAKHRCVHSTRAIGRTAMKTVLKA